MSIFKKIGRVNSSKSRISSLSKGFTLVELLVVIAIIGILATLILLQLGTARAKARDAKRIADVSQIRTAAELFFDDNGGKYPGSAPLHPCSSAGAACTGAPGANNNLTEYISATSLPIDPLTGGIYGYTFNTDTGRTQYQVWADLERRAPAAFSADADINSNLATAWNGSGGVNVNGANESATTCNLTTAIYDCVYDVGQR